MMSQVTVMMQNVLDKRKIEFFARDQIQSSSEVLAERIFVPKGNCSAATTRVSGVVPKDIGEETAKVLHPQPHPQQQSLVKDSKGKESLEDEYYISLNESNFFFEHDLSLSTPDLSEFTEYTENSVLETVMVY